MVAVLACVAVICCGAIAAPAGEGLRECVVLNSGLLRVWHGVCLGVAACPNSHYSRWFAHRAAPVAASTPVGCCHRGATPTGENLKRKQRARNDDSLVHSHELHT